MYTFDLGVFGGVFAVPNAIVDEHIKIATSNHLKVLLYCLRHSGNALSAGEISRATGVAPDDVTAAMAFWEQRSVTDTNTSAPPPIVADVPVTNTASEVKKANKVLSGDYVFSPKEIAELLENDKDVKFLFERAEVLFGRPLTRPEHGALAVIVADVGMKPEVALVLVGYCADAKKTSPSYIKTVAKDWFNRGIDSYEKAELIARELKAGVGLTNPAGKAAVGGAKVANVKKNKALDTATPATYDLDKLKEQIRDRREKRIKSREGSNEL
ncbi:MAG: DnaD domain protein [Oscillospiraceae bacterium]|nr:DnaD domain protein [Oscillospiraceae bacterium]